MEVEPPAEAVPPPRLPEAGAAAAQGGQDAGWRPQLRPASAEPAAASSAAPAQEVPAEPAAASGAAPAAEVKKEASAPFYAGQVLQREDRLFRYGRDGEAVVPFYQARMLRKGNPKFTELPADAPIDEFSFARSLEMDRQFEAKVSLRKGPAAEDSAAPKQEAAEASEAKVEPKTEPLSSAGSSTDKPLRNKRLPRRPHLRGTGRRSLRRRHLTRPRQQRRPRSLPSRQHQLRPALQIRMPF